MAASIIFKPSDIDHVSITLNGKEVYARGPAFDVAAPRGEYTALATIRMRPPTYANRLNYDRQALEAITACVVCTKAIEPRTEAEHDACESLGVHLGACWNEYKRRACNGSP